MRIGIKFKMISCIISIKVWIQIWPLGLFIKLQKNIFHLEIK